MMPNRSLRLAPLDASVEPSVSIDDAWRSSSRAATEAASRTKIVPLFTDPDILDGEPQPPIIDWPAAIEHIRDVAARVRRARDFAHEVSRHSQSIIQRSLKQTEDAERRANAAEASAAAAMLRAEKAEELVRLLEARAQLAEKESATAKAAEAEAQLWLRRVHACLKDEFNDLIVDPV